MLQPTVRKLSDILAEQQRPDDRNLTSRSDARRLRRAQEDHLAQLAQSLVALSEHKLMSLDLPEEVVEAAIEAKRITSPIAKNRQLRIVRRALRHADDEAVERKVERLVHPATPGAPRPEPESSWLERLLRGGDGALQELVDTYPSADRQRLRQLTRNLKNAKPERAAASRTALERALRELLAKG